jgi:hypothetical protein
MTSLLAGLGLMVVTLALLALPVTPALYELLKRADASPLPTSRHDGRVENFAQAFRARVAPWRAELERCRTTGEVLRQSEGGMTVLLVGNDQFDFSPRLTHGADAVLSAGALSVPPNCVLRADIASDAGLVLGERASVRAAVAGTDIELGPGSTVLRWIHANHNLRLRARSTVSGRLSAGKTIRLETGASFQHMHAPEIVTLGLAEGPEPATGDLGPHDPGGNDSAATGDGPNTKVDTFASRPRLRIEGDFALAPGETLDANLVVTGDLRLGRGARFLGAAKSYGDVVLAEDASVLGPIVSQSTVRIGPGCFVSGPILAENEVLAACRSRVGEPDRLTTVSARSIKLAAGCQLHGTVWARVRGSVEA